MTAVPIWRRKTVRRITLQGLFVAAIAVVIGAGIMTARKNLAAQGISSGFGFLWKSTGWDLNFSLVPVSSADPYWWYLVAGIINTLFLGLIALFFATILGLVVGLARTSRNAPARLLGTTYIEIFRNIPLIVQVFFWYAASTQLPNPRNAITLGEIMISGRGIYLPGLNVGSGFAALAVLVLFVTLGLILWISVARRFRRVQPARSRNLRLAVLAVGLALMAAILFLGRIPDTPLISHPELKGLNIRGGIRIQPELYVLAFSIALYGAAYIGEIVRGGFRSVGRGQVEAAQALGLTAWQVFSRVRLPLAVRAALPILINQYVWLIKATTLGIAVGFSDFFMVVAGSITHSGQTLELIGILMAGFLLINFTLAAILNRINRAIALKGKQIGVAA